MRIAIIGGGISGIAAARVLLRFGHEVVVLERGPRLGGVWAVTYPEVRLQNIAEHYRLSDFPWPFQPDLHPTREQILRYLEEVVAHFNIDLRVSQKVVAMNEAPEGWDVEIESPDGASRERFDFVVIASGQYTGSPRSPELADRDRFQGEVLTDRQVLDLDLLTGKKVAVVGFGKTAVDMATFAAKRGAEVHHVFREPRWLIPRYILGVHMANLLFSRMSTAMIPSWVHPSEGERFLHDRMMPVVNGFWSMIAGVVSLQNGLLGLERDPEARRRLALLRPEAPVPFQMRSALALAPDDYFSSVASGKIEPHRGETAGFVEHGLRLTDGREIPCDLVILSTGFTSPRFPYLPDVYRTLLEREDDGAQLYRHLLHPRIPRLAFAGQNHGFLHVPGIELSMLWLAAQLRGDLRLPPVEEMEQRIDEIRRWKEEHILFEPSRGGAVSTRFHQYFDVLLGDLGLPHRRKSNPISELFAPYGAADYAGVLDEYEKSRVGATAPRDPLPLST
jgi:cation diffusion facilitator CzcD-associated flavoprotein CzcO